MTEGTERAEWLAGLKEGDTVSLVSNWDELEVEITKVTAKLIYYKRYGIQQADRAKGISSRGSLQPNDEASKLRRAQVRATGKRVNALAARMTPDIPAELLSRIEDLLAENGY